MNIWFFPIFVWHLFWADRICTLNFHFKGYINNKELKHSYVAQGINKTKSLRIFELDEIQMPGY